MRQGLLVWNDRQGTRFRNFTHPETQIALTLDHLPGIAIIKALVGNPGIWAAGNETNGDFLVVAGAFL